MVGVIAVWSAFRGYGEGLDAVGVRIWCGVAVNGDENIGEASGFGPWFEFHSFVICSGIQYGITSLAEDLTGKVGDFAVTFFLAGAFAFSSWVFAAVSGIKDNGI